MSAVGLAQIDRSVTCLQLMPLAFRDWREVDYVRQKIAPDLEGRLRAKGFEVLFWADAGWVRYFSKAPAYAPR
jgi:TRAP-type C4-dicarboxylate transport system substrate-binding protein